LLKSKFKYSPCIEESQNSKINKLIKILGVGEFDHLKLTKVRTFEWLLVFEEKLKCPGKMISFNLTGTLK